MSILEGTVNMDSVGETGDPFAIPDLWRKSTLPGSGFEDPEHVSIALDDIGRRFCTFWREAGLINMARFSRKCSYALPTSQRLSTRVYRSFSSRSS
jgi:hypothetical protein